MTQSNTNSTARINLTDTINETLAQYPASLRVFHVFGIHTCCDGALSLEAAAVKSKVDPQLLVELLSDSVASEAAG